MASKPTAEKPPNKIVFEYRQTSNHRTVFVDGAVGGTNFQQQNMLRVSFYREFMPPLRETRPLLQTDEGSLKVGAPGQVDMSDEVNIVREIDTTLMLTARTARELSDWLAEQVDSIEQASRP
ncbi:MAG: hypothetical protein OXJ53_03395 [Gammaproteobacteria bacterium]|nr:hypothetical protein [Gammaproteobacteria bacterium]MDE0273405.1 hypothetical protein [Gammaproteobacteria bacterium]